MSAYGAMGAHQSAAMASDVWLTPPFILDALGPFDLDPCAAVAQPWATAKRMLTVEDDGLAHEWDGRVWLNPPYGLVAARWLDRLARHGTGTALIFARTETRMFFDHVWPKASSVLFLEGRLYFHHPDGTRAKANSGAPSVLVSYGEEDAWRLAHCRLAGSWFPVNTECAA
jgi:hypothetical protein